jgi:peptidoglycan/LPS O-acetylase OafA/YrhL
VWPLLIFIIRWKWLKYVFPGIVLLSIAFKLFFFSFSHSFFTYNDLLPIYTFDAFGVGAVLAIIPFEGEKWLKKLDVIPFNAGFFISVFLSILVYKLKLSFLFSLTVSCASFFLIRQARTGFKGIPGAVLNNRIFRYLGKISYGLYIYHNFMPWLWRCLTGRETANPLPIPSIHYPPLTGPYISFVIQLCLLVAIASVSWFLVEKPLNDLKRLADSKTPVKKQSVVSGRAGQ